jgi:hypothetical protein
LIAYVGGRADAVPVCGGSCGAAWLSTVIHHFGDLPAVAIELRRVLPSGAPVLIRERFTGRTGDRGRGVVPAPANSSAGTLRAEVGPPGSGQSSSAQAAVSPVTTVGGSMRPPP